MVAANRLVGNPDHAAVLEITLGGMAARLPAGGRVAVTGARVPVRVNGQAANASGPIDLPPGGRLDIGTASSGLRCYLAVAGGIAVEPVLGSRSTDTLSGLGPPVVRAGTTLPVGTVPPIGTVPAPAAPTDAGRGDAAPAPAVVTLRIRYGPRADWFTEQALSTLAREAYTVGMHSNRIGARLSGPALARSRDGELPSEGIVLGAVQVPGDGQPLVFLADHPSTGGYPVIAVVDPADLPLLAQCRPGATVRFRGPQQ
jgi:biotin-dependent carboxylase-like uncharacterized protein